MAEESHANVQRTLGLLLLEEDVALSCPTPRMNEIPTSCKVFDEVHDIPASWGQISGLPTCARHKRSTSMLRHKHVPVARVPHLFSS